MDITTQLTWQYNVNQSLASQASAVLTCGQLLRSIKNSLIGFASNPWTIKGSCNGTVAAMDGVDRWSANTDVVFPTTPGTNPRSWIVLKQTSGFGSSFELLIGCGASGSVQAYVATSFTGYSGGTTTALPTATQEQVFSNGVFQPNTTSKRILHVTQSSLEGITRVFVFDVSLQTVTACMLFERVKNPVAGWLTPYLFYAKGNATGSAASYNGLSDTSLARAYHNGSWYQISMTYETYFGNSMFRRNFSAIRQQYETTKIGVAGTAVGFRGYHGIMFDMYWFGSSVNQVPESFMTNTYVSFNDIMIPWNGTPVITT